MIGTIIGSRSLDLDLKKDLIGDHFTQIVSGAAKGVDSAVRRYCYKHKIQIYEVIPEYDKYLKIAPLKRNDIMIDLCDEVVIFWDGESRGTKYCINRCKKLKKPMRVYLYAEKAFTLVEQIPLPENYIPKPKLY